VEKAETDLESATEMFVETEKAAVREILGVERNIFTTFAAGWKQVIAEEFAMLSQVEKLGEVIEKIDKEMFYPCNMLDRSEHCLTPDMEKSCSLYTPASSPYSGSKARSESRKSQHSFSSRQSSVDSQIDDRTLVMSSWNNTLVYGKGCPREGLYNLSLYQQEQQGIWLDREQGSMQAGEDYRPSLPQRGILPEPHYSVPQNNTRVVVVVGPEEQGKVGDRMTGDRMDMVDLHPGEGVVCVSEEKKELELSSSESSSSGYCSTEVQQCIGGYST
jgi:hypothetical protein